MSGSWGAAAVMESISSSQVFLVMFIHGEPAFLERCEGRHSLSAATVGSVLLCVEQGDMWVQSEHVSGCPVLTAQKQLHGGKRRPCAMLQIRA